MKNSINGALLAGCASIVVGGVTLVYAMRTGLYAWRSRRWPRVTYEVDGLEYRNDQMEFGFDDFLGDGLFRNSFNAEKVAAHYRPGNPVSVAYDPQHYSRSVLKTGINKGHVATTIFGLFFIGFGICCFWSLLSR